MVEFKKNVKEVLPYDRKRYITRANWYWISFQLPGVFEGRNIGLEKFIEVYEPWFKNLISGFDNNSFWIVNHDKRDLEWFPVGANNLTGLGALFKQNNIPNTFRGAIIFAQDDLMGFSKDLISYPYILLENVGFLYENLDISHRELPIILKISAQWEISVYSTNKEVLMEVANKNALTSFVLIKNW